MTRISGAAASRPASKVTAAPGAGRGFSLPPEPASTSAEPAIGGTSAAGPPAGILSLQEAGEYQAIDQQADDRARDDCAQRHGKTLLEALAALQHGLLGQGLDPAALDRIVALSDAPQAADPRLQAIMRAIACRAAVELARRGHT